MFWTKAQQKVIDTRNKNILVSAAAGSGKTAVLVERIISMISEGENPIDIDHILVVTFTNAAAAQMRERIGRALDKKLAQDPENQHLQKQVFLLQSANIMTIHSFCLNVIRNYFHHIDLDPSFKLADDSENTLLKSDVVSEVLERWYEEGREDFHEFIECYSRSKSDLPIEELMIQLYHFCMSNPWPKMWIQEMEQSFRMTCLEDMEQTPWMKELLTYIGFILRDLSHKNDTALAICLEADGPGAYEQALLSDRELILKLQQGKSYQEYAGLFADISYARLSSKREEGVDPDKKEAIKGLREEVKKGIKEIANQFFFQSPEEMLRDMAEVDRMMRVLFELTLDFMDSFARKKEEKNVLDFNDLEHFALDILVQHGPEGVVPGRAALELCEFFEEILIDEYQDSNLVQETILASISREKTGQPNRFMVGDVKQSIYKFRLAMPELFMDKYKNYPTEDFLENGEENRYLRIDLDQNFRSRKIVLDGVNQIFEQIMTEAVGGIRYDDAASLKYGYLFEELMEESPVQGEEGMEPEEETAERKQQDSKGSDGGRDRIAKDMELILVTEEEPEEPAGGRRFGNEESGFYENTSEDDSDESESEENRIFTKKELEARAIVRRIKEIVDPHQGLMVFDREKKSHRPARYGDIVILLRSMSGWSELFVNTLMQEGIPAYADTSTGYFQTLEIMTLLNMLRIIDNPRQDIPLAGVLYSPMVGLTTTELAKIRIMNRKSGLYQGVCDYTEEDCLRDKLQSFLLMLDELRAMVEYCPIHEIIIEILERTGYHHYVLALPAGDRRKANIDMLINKAVMFEKGSYSGLFHFIRYIEKLHRYEVDFGEAAAEGEQGDTVRIMSIHKSKGLEFPVVFAAGLSKQFNTQDLRKNIVLHNEFGVGPEYINVKERTKVPTLLKKVIQKKIQIENIGEELRVLYVAMTRAKEKLILTGYLNSVRDIKRKRFSVYELTTAKTFMDYVLPALLNTLEYRETSEEFSEEISGEGIRISLVRKSEILSEELAKQIAFVGDKEEWNEITSDIVYDPEIREQLKQFAEYSYPYKADSVQKAKLSVSEIKKMEQVTQEEEAQPLIEENDKTDIPATIPEFILGAQEEVNAVHLGTLYHKILYLLNLDAAVDKEGLEEELERMEKEGRIRGEEKKQVNHSYLLRFVQSRTAERMRKARVEGKLYKEKQFVMGIPALEMTGEQSDDEMILIQGIIDVFFEEEDGVVVVDYKSDVVENGQELVNRYGTQLRYYKKALEQILNCSVKEMIIYSLRLGQEIPVP